MCKQHSSSKYNNGRKGNTVDEKIKFYRNLRAFIGFNFIIPAIWMVSGHADGLWKVSLIWGIFLFIKSIKLFGVPGTDGWLSSDFEDWQAQRRYDEPLDDFDSEPKAEPLFDKASWREKDLV